MAARLHLLLCVSVAALLVMPSCCDASRAAGVRSLLFSTNAFEDDTEVSMNDFNARVPASAAVKNVEFGQWARFLKVDEVAVDYNPPEANPNPGDPSPTGD